ncbi:MAG TPA: hypothetical protein VJB06_00885, partial [archaeon]|nr:hypothetical protein [archaeon]
LRTLGESVTDPWEQCAAELAELPEHIRKRMVGSVSPEEREAAKADYESKMVNRGRFSNQTRLRQPELLSIKELSNYFLESGIPGGDGELSFELQNLYIIKPVDEQEK